MAEFYDLFHHAELRQESRSHFQGHAPLGASPDESDPLTSEYTDTLPFKGQGTIVVLSKAEHLLSFKVETEAKDLPNMHLDIGVNDYHFYYKLGETRTEIPVIPTKSKDAPFLIPGQETKYWLSIDHENGLLRYGKYFPTKALTLLEARLKAPKGTGNALKAKTVKDGWEHEPKVTQKAAPELGWVDSTWEWIKELKKVEATADDASVDTSSIVIGPLPVVIDLAPVVADPNQITLTDLESGFRIAPINLPLACQELYGNIQGAAINLDDAEFPSFSAAIQYSINTPGCWAYEKLREKAASGEFDDGLKGTYLRITLGYNLGDSPGIPYVMEIWPSGHHSPIHNHGQACAVIRVLHGQITCNWYSDLRRPTQINAPQPLGKGEVTWISPRYYQIHKLENRTKDVCVTIQCYRYAGEDNVHYDGFDFIKKDGIAKFVPDSDMAFLEFKQKILEEWNAPLEPDSN